MNVPVECLPFSPEEASKDKQMVARLEGKAAQALRIHSEVVGEVEAQTTQLVEEHSCSFIFLTASMIHWTDQVKEALTDHKPGQSVLKKGWGPLQELDLWRSRSTKLLDIEKQLLSPEVKHVLSILQISKSVYVQRFLKLTKEIQVGRIWNELLNYTSVSELNLRCTVHISHPLLLKKKHVIVDFLAFLVSRCS